jgi:hypothetical protein
MPEQNARTSGALDAPSWLFQTRSGEVAEVG